MKIASQLAEPEEWLSPMKMREYYVDHATRFIEESERRLFLAVVAGEVRARLIGHVLDTERLKQIAKLKTDESNPFSLPPDLELSVKDARRKWRA